MGWDRGRYYTRSRKVNGRVVREYVGTGRVAELVAEMDSLERQQRRLDAQTLHQEKAELAPDVDLIELIETTDLLARAALLAAGFHRHHRGEWRKRREQGEG